MTAGLEKSSASVLMMEFLTPGIRHRASLDNLLSRRCIARVLDSRPLQNRVAAAANIGMTTRVQTRKKNNENNVLQAVSAVLIIFRGNAYTIVRKQRIVFSMLMRAKYFHGLK